MIYANRYNVNDPDSEASPPAPDDYLTRLSASDIALRNFPGPAIIEWHSKDGAYHKATIDIEKIFSNGKILHNANPADIPPNAYIFSPDIIIVVNDRNISVYMKAHIPLKRPRIPPRPLSNFVDEAVLAFSTDY